MTTQELRRHYGRGNGYDPAVVARARDLVINGRMSYSAVARELGVAHTSVARWLNGGGRVESEYDRARRERKRIAFGMVASGVPYYRVSRSLGMSEGTLRRWFGPSRHDPAERMAVLNAQRQRESEFRYAEMVRLRMVAGLTNGQIAEALGTSARTVWNYMGPTPKRLGGSRPWHPAMHERARFLRGCGNTIREIADKTGVPRSTVSDWVRGMPCG